VPDSASQNARHHHGQNGISLKNAIRMASFWKIKYRGGDDPINFYTDEPP